MQLVFLKLIHPPYVPVRYTTVPASVHEPLIEASWHPDIGQLIIVSVNRSFIVASPTAAAVRPERVFSPRINRANPFMWQWVGRAYLHLSR